MIEVTRVGGGPWNQNCFVVTKHDEAIVIDPGGGPDLVLREFDKSGNRLVGMLNTHGHFDHIGAVQEIAEVTSTPFYISSKEVPIMRNSNLLRFIFGYKQKIRIPNEFVDLESEVSPLLLGGFSIQLLKTPGHTPGGHCFVLENHIFTGDTVLSKMAGTSELPGGNASDLMNSLVLLDGLDQSLIAHPGHGKDLLLGDALKSARSFFELGDK